MNARPVYLLDANVLLRFLLNDQAAHGAAAKKLFDHAATGKNQLLIPQIAITETIFTLQSYYGVDRQDIGRELLKILNASGVKLTCPAWILDAVDLFRTRNVSFGDACLAAEAAANRFTVASFDRGLDKFLIMNRHEPRA